MIEIVRRLSRALFALSLAALLPAATFAEGGTKLIQASADPLGQGLLPVVGQHDMEGKRWGFAVSPFLWKTTNIAQDGHCCTTTGGSVSGDDSLPDLHGEGGALSFSVEFTPHWGAQVFGAKSFGRNADLGGKVSGLAPRTAALGTPGGAGLAGGTFNNFTASAFGAMATWDHFSGKDAVFRLPVSVGLFYGSQTLDFDHTYNNAGTIQTETVRVRRNYPGVVAAVSADFTVFKDFRVAPGILVGQGFTGQETSIHYVVEKNGATKYYPNEITGTPGFGTVYGSLGYKPWGVGYTFTLIPGLATTHAITFGHKFSWGGGEAK